MNCYKYRRRGFNDVKTFKDTQEVNIWLERNYSSDIKKLNDVDNPKYKPLHFYTGNAFVWWNKVLRTSKCIDLNDLKRYVSNSSDSIFIDDDFDSITKIRQLLSEVKICEDIVVYRFMKKSDFKKLLLNKISKNVYIDYGFLSTTLLPFSEDIYKLRNDRGYQILLKLNVPKGTNGMPIKYDRKHSAIEEYEVILDFGLKLEFKRKCFYWKHYIKVYEFDILI